uniref:DRIM domain-containing protein n=1 Tax=Parastrongyloides trichosuri TaxID=131310 RepID=A0A0N4Z929_PARTI
MSNNNEMGSTSYEILNSLPTENDDDYKKLPEHVYNVFSQEKETEELIEKLNKIFADYINKPKEYPSYIVIFLSVLEECLKNKNLINYKLLNVECLIKFCQLNFDCPMGYTLLEDLLERENITNVITLSFCKKHLSSCHISIRLVILNFLKKYKLVGGTYLDFLIDAEKQSPDLRFYQERAKFLRKLQYGNHKKYISCSDDEEIILRTLLAQYSVNFTIYWPKIDEIVSSYGTGMNEKEFFIIWKDVYTMATEKKDVYPYEVSNKIASFKNKNEDRSDRYLLRLNLVKALSKLISVLEENFNDLSIIFKNLYYNEFKSKDPNSYLTVNLITPPVKEKEIPLDEALAQGRIYKTKDTVTEFCNNISRISRLGTLDKNNVVKDIVDSILMDGDPRLLKPAIAIIKAFKFKHVNSYIETFEELGDQHKFKNALLKFQLNFDELATDKFVHQNHRGELMKLIVKILYGKICYAKNDAKKNERKPMFQFLVVLDGEEVKMFLQIIYKKLINYFNEYFDNNVLNVDKFGKYIENADMHSFINPYLLKNMLDYTNLIAQNMRMKLTNEDVTFVSDICLVILSCITKYFEFFKKLDKNEQPNEEEHIAYRYNSILKDLRKQVTQIWAQLFTNFGRQPFLTIEKFEYFWNELITKHTAMKMKSVKHLNYSESINIVFPDHILKFFIPLTVSITMIPLFSMKIALMKSKYTEVYPMLLQVDVLEVLTNSLISNYTMAPVKNEIVTGFCEIARLHEIEETSDYLTNYNTITGNSLINKYARNLGNYFSQYLIETDTPKRMKQNELNLISIISQDIPFELADQFIKLFVYYIQHNSYSDEQVNFNILRTIAKLLILVNQSDNQDDYIWTLPIIVPLLSSRQLRKGFMQLLDTLKTLKSVENNKDLILQIDALGMLNETSTGYVGIETFDRRMEGYDELEKYCTSGKMFNKDIFKSLLYTNDFFITKNTDLSCNQSAEYSYCNLIEHLASASYSEDYKKEILTLYEFLISRRVCAKQEDVRNSFIKILSSYVTSFSEGHKFSPLYALKTLEEDFDFFEEIISIQLNRKQKAFIVLREWIQNNGNVLNEILLHQIIVPIAKPYMDDIHKDKTTLSDEAIKLFSVVMEHTRWKKFNNVMNSLIVRLLKATETVQVRLLVKQLNACLEGFKVDLRHIKEEEALFDTSIERNKPVVDEEEVIIHDTIETMDIDENEEKNEDIDMKDEKEEDPITSYEEAIEIVKQFESYTIPKLVSIINCNNLNIKQKSIDGKKIYVEDYYILRAPIVLPLVKILVKMPNFIIKKYKHGVVSKLCSLLICHTPEIREKARKIMVEVSLTFGPEQLSFIIYEIGKLLKKGFQAHVGIYTIHTILISQKNLKPGDLDKSYKLLLENCFLDQFSVIAEEKEVQQIRSKCPEAKENKSKFIYRILGQNCKLNAFELFETMSFEQLNEAPDSETFRKIYSNCESFAAGAAKNICVSPDEIVKYGLGIFDKHLANCLKKEVVKADDDDDWKSHKPKDCYLIEAEPKRLGQMSKTAQKSRNVVFIAFALQLISGALNKKKLDINNESVKSNIEKFVPILIKCMELRSDKLQNYSLTCVLNLYNNFDLPILQEQVNDFINQLFIILKNVSGTTSANNDLKQKLFSAFKIFIGNKKPVSFTDKQIKILFANIKIEMFSQSVQANAMNILKEVVKSKIGYEQISEIMEFCITQAVQSTMQKLRDSTRDVIKIYVKHNPKINHDKLIAFIMDQFQYALPHGKKSALELFTIFLDFIDQSRWEKEGLNCLIRLSLLFDDDSDEVQNFARLTMVKLFEKSSGSVQSDILGGLQKLISNKKMPIFLSGMKGIVSLSRSPFSKQLSKELLDDFMKIVKIKFVKASTIFTDKYFEIFIQEFFMFFEKMHSRYKMKDIYDNEFLEILLNVTTSIENAQIIQNIYKLIFMYLNFYQLTESEYEKLFEGILFQSESYTFNLQTVTIIGKNLVLIINKCNNDELKKNIIKLLDTIGKQDLKTPTTTFTRRCLTLLVLQHVIITKDDVNETEMKWNRELFDSLFHFIYRHDVIKKSGSLDVLPTNQSEVIKDFEELVNVNIKKFSMLLGNEFTTRLGVIKNQLENKRLERKKAKFEEKIRDPQRAAEKKIASKQKQMEREKLKRKRVQELKAAGVYEYKKKKKAVVSFDEI